MNLLIFQNPCEFFQFFFDGYKKTVFEKKIETTTGQLLIQSTEKFLYVIWNVVTKTYPKFVTLRLFFKILKNLKKIEQNYMDSTNLIYLFEIKRV